MELSGNCSVGYYCVFGVVLLNLYMINLIQCFVYFKYIIIGDVCFCGYFCKVGSVMFGGIYINESDICNKIFRFYVDNNY